jgi:homoserine kinase
VFAWFSDPASAQAAVAGMQAGFAAAGLASEAFVGPVDAPGARVESRA